MITLKTWMGYVRRTGSRSLQPVGRHKISR